MKFKNIHIISLIVSMLYLTVLSAQPMENNSASERAKNKIKREIGYYQHNEDDEYFEGATCKMWNKTYDSFGRLITYMDYWQCGKPYCFYEYEYNESGKCIRSWISYYTNNFKRTEMVHRYDSNENIIKRWPSKTIPTYPPFFTNTYNDKGQMIEHKEWRIRNGKKYIDYSSTWNNKTTVDLTPEYSVFNKNGGVRWVVIKEYQYYD